MYTFHKDFLTLSFPMVDEEEMKKEDDKKYTNTRLRYK
jgi:hypothetical protein